MDYTYDVCMNNFTSEQARRMRCTLESFRVGLVSTAPNSAPFVSIAAPASGTSYDEGTLIGFSGSAVDAEDGTISPSISWSSSLDGFLGTGETIFTALSVGTHTVTASATDSAGATGSDSVSVTVNPVGGGGISLSGTSHKEKGRVFVDLSWSGATGGSVDVYRDGALVATTANDGAFTDATGLKGSGSIAYQVCEAGTSTCSAVVVVGY
jgi:hypothetical protein